MTATRAQTAQSKRERAREMLGRGSTYRQIASAVGLSHTTINKVRRAADIPPRSRGGSKTTSEPSSVAQAVLDLLDAGDLTKAEIARRFGVSRQRIRQIQRRWRPNEVQAP